MSSPPDLDLVESLLKGSNAPTLLCPTADLSKSHQNLVFTSVFGQNGSAVQTLLQRGITHQQTSYCNLTSESDGKIWRFIIERILHRDETWIFAKGIDLSASAHDTSSKTVFLSTSHELFSLLHTGNIERVGFFFDDFNTDEFHATNNWYNLLGIEKPDHLCSYEDIISSQLTAEESTDVLLRREQAKQSDNPYRSWHGQFGRTPKQRSLITNIHIEHDDDGKPIGSFGITMEIPELRQLSHQLKHERDVFAKAQHIAKVGHIHDNFETGFWHASKSFFELIGYSPVDKNIPYESSIDLEISALIPCLKQELRESFRAGIIPTRIFCETQRHDTEEKVCLEISAHPEYSPDGDIIGFFSIIVDVSEARQLYAELAEQQELHLQAQEVAKFGHFTLDPETYEVSVSPVLFQLSGLQENCIPHTYQKIIAIMTDDDSRKKSEQRLQSFLQDPVPYDADIPIKRADTGERRIMRMSVKADIDESKIRKVIGTIRDVTEEVTLAKELELERTLFKRAQRIGKIGHAVDDIQHGRFQASDILWELLGLPPQRRDLPYKDIAPLFLPPQEVEASLKRREEAIKNGVPYKFELNTKRRDTGDPVIFTVENYPQKDNNGNVTEFFSVVADVTEERLLQSALDYERHLFARAQEFAKIGHFIDNIREGTFQASEMLWELAGLPPDEAPPSTYDDMLELFLTPQERTLVHARREQALQDGEPYSAQITVHINSTNENHQFWTEVFPETDENGVVKAFFGIVQDITDRLEAEQSREQLEFALQEAQRMEALNYFAGGMAHELGNFLQPALNFGALAQSAAQKGDYTSSIHYTERVLAAVTRASDVTRRALQYVRNAPTQAKPIKLSDALQDARTILSSTAKNLEWHVEQGIEREEIIADGTGLLQVLLNLVMNATEAAGEAVQIDIRLQRTAVDSEEAVTRGVTAGDYVRLTFRDDGPGIPSSVQGVLFDPLVTSKSDGRGTGLGLPVSKALTERWGGTLYLASTGAWGASFEALIPISATHLHESHQT